jgi:DinB superfamily
VNEAVQKYVDRILGYTQGQKPLKVQAATASTLARLVKGVSASKLRKRPAPEQWSVIEILAHLADSEVVCGWRLRAIVGAPGTPIEAYDQNAWAAAGHYATRDPNQCIEQFRAMRKANLSLLNSLTPEQWSHCGMHAERGKETVEQIVSLIAGHDLNHVQQIERILASPKRRPVRIAA